MSWWQRFFRRSESRQDPQTIHDHGLIRGVMMTVPGWHEDPPEDAMRKWHHPNGGVLSLAAASRAAIPPLLHLESLRNSFRRIAEAGGGALVEANVVQSPYGPSAQMIYKKQQGMGFLFTGMLLLPAEDQWLVCTVVDAERGVTGVREAVVTAQMLEAGELTIEDYEESWARDPYDPQHRGDDRRGLRYISDDERYDAQFPEHPLSNVRNTLKALLENVFIDS